MTVNDDALVALGRYIRAQRELADVSLRHFAKTVNISDSYLSQVERGLYRPSGDVLQAIARGLGLAPDELFRRLGWLPEGDEAVSVGVPEAISADPKLSQAEKSALLQMYRTMVDRD
jgi:transcriptional regulator with XRE-family HTH domain